MVIIVMPFMAQILQICFFVYGIKQGNDIPRTVFNQRQCGHPGCAGQLSCQSKITSSTCVRTLKLLILVQGFSGVCTSCEFKGISTTGRSRVLEKKSIDLKSSVEVDVCVCCCLFALFTAR